MALRKCRLPTPLTQSTVHIQEINKLSLQMLQACEFGGPASGGGDLDFLSLLRGEFPKKEPSLLQHFLGFLERSIGRGVSLISCYDVRYSTETDAINSCRARDSSNGRLPRSISRHLYLKGRLLIDQRLRAEC